MRLFKERKFNAERYIAGQRRKVLYVALFGVVIFLVPLTSIGVVVAGIVAGDPLLILGGTSSLVFFGLMTGREIKEAFADGAATYGYMRAGKL